MTWLGRGLLDDQNRTAANNVMCRDLRVCDLRVHVAAAVE